MEKIIPTDEVATNEPVHPDRAVRRRLVEFALSDCPFGCKIYKDPRSNFTVLAHSAVYGCAIRL